MKIKKAIALMVCICFIFSFCFNDVMAAEKVNYDKSQIKVVKNDDKLCSVMGTYDDDELYASLDKETNKISMKAVEKPKVNILGISMGKEKVTNYDVKIDTLVDGEVSAILTDIASKKEYKIGKSEKVKAQVPALIPLVEILGPALLEALGAAATAIVLAGITYYAATTVVQTLRNQSHNYYIARLYNNILYIGGAFPSDSAAYAWLQSTSHNVFAINRGLAFDAAISCSTHIPPQAIYNIPHGGGGYLPHYHPRTQTGQQGSQHCWY